MGCVCTSSRTAAEVERSRRVPLALGNCRTHLRHALNWRRVGVEAMVWMISTMFKSDGAAGKCGDDHTSAFRRTSASNSDDWDNCTTTTGMASTRISAPMRGATHQLRRLSVRPNALCTRCAVCYLAVTVCDMLTSSRNLYARPPPAQSPHLRPLRRH